MKARFIRVEGALAFIPLTKGFEAVIDAADVHLVDSWSWYANVQTYTVYAQRCDTSRGNKTTVMLHRQIMGSPEGMFIDHRDMDGLDCRRANLRIASHSQNNQNQRLVKSNTSGFKGACWEKSTSKWSSHIRVNGSRRYLGLYSSALEAHNAYCTASAELHGEFGRTK